MPCTIIRLAGCPLRCHYCDTVAAQAVESGKWMEIRAIARDVARRNRPLVLVTGGEPLAQRNCIALLEQLRLEQRMVQLETSGAFSIASIPSGVCRIIDIKTPDSGEAARNRLDNLSLLRPDDEVKFVICSRKDYQWARDFIARHELVRAGVAILFSPAWGMISAADMSQWILADQLPVRLQLQMHKVIWGANATAV
jgi:7-carboxy-7-deazaguanine synthase